MSIHISDPTDDILKEVPPNLIKDTLGKELLEEITFPLMQILKSSVAIYEKDGTYAFELYTSNWCDLLNSVSRKLCKTNDPIKAMNSGKWLCHESCWRDCSKINVDTGKAALTNCYGGIQILGVPIFLNEEVIGSINAGFGAIPQDTKILQKIAKKYQISVEELQEIAKNSPQENILSKSSLEHYLNTIARLIGELVHRTLIQRQLQNKSDLSQEYLNLAGDITVIINRDAKIRWINAPGANLLGYTQNQLIGKNWFKVCLPQQVQSEVMKVFEKTMAGNYEPYLVYENEILTKDGVEKTVLWKNSYISDNEGKTTASLSVGIDISYQKEVENQIKETEQRNRFLLETVPFGIIFVDKEGTFTYANSYAKEILLLQEHDIHNLKFFQIEWNVFDLEGNPLQKTEYPFNIVKNTLEPVKNPQILLRRHEEDTISEKIISVNATPILDNSNKFNGIIASIEDITENAKKLREKTKSRNIESLGILAAGIAHNFNNLLTIVTGNLSLAKDLLEQNEIEDLGVCLTECNEAMDKAKLLTQQLLTFSRGGAPLKKRTAFKQFLEHTIAEISPEVSAKIKRSIKAKLGSLQFDRDQIRQVLHHIIYNADQAMVHGGIITITAREASSEDIIRFSLPSLHYVCITVQDEGIGIPREDIPKIFDPYFTTKEGQQGLGLSISYSIISRHKGKLYVESKINRGTIFYIFLPLSD